MDTTNSFGARVAFIFENRSKTYTEYGDARTAGEKDAMAQKFLQYFWLDQKAGRNGE